MGVRKKFRRMMAYLLIMLLLISHAMPLVAKAKETDRKVVRVGWYDSSFCYLDRFGRRCGIDYEYQQKISAYTGWTYEYVEDSWPNLLQMLKEGKIDLLSDVSHKPEREEYMLYPDLPMGTEAYYIYVSVNNVDLDAKRLSTFNGKRIGVNKDSVQEGFLREWEEKNNLSLKIVPITVTEEQSMEMIAKGELDGYASVYTYNAEQKAVPICRIGGADYFYAVTKSRPDLLAELNVALAGIQDEDPYFYERLSDERMYNSKTNLSLTPIQEEWLINHHVIRVGYRENYAPFCQTDERTGELTGALKDFLAHTENNLNVEVIFETVPYDTTEAAIEALKKGEVDCVFPVYLCSYDADQMGIRLTSPAMKTEMHAVMRTSEERGLSQKSEIIFAVDAGNLNNDTFIMDEYPATHRKTFKDKTACFQAVASGEADCTLISSYRVAWAEETFKKNKLYAVPTGEAISLSFAVKKDENELYFLLNKSVAVTSAEDMDAALVSYLHSDRKVTFMQFMEDNWISVVCILIVVFSIVIFLLVQKMKAERTANEQKHLLEEAAEIAELKQTISSLLDNMPGMNFTKDAETGVYLACNQAFASYANKKDPSEVVGLTPADIFDPEKAKNFLEDDKMALAMDGPYVYFEDVTGEDGSRKQIKTTKLKYVDANGRLCVLGMFLDVTDSFRISRDHAKTKESYEKARNTGIIFTQIAQALANGYVNLFYVDLNTEEFIEYQTDEDNGNLAEVRRGWHFFEICQDEAQEYVWPEDRDGVIKALDRRTLVAALDQNNTFMMTYRRNGANGPVYVNLKVTRLQEDDRYVILAITDVDEQMKEHNVAAKVREERLAYNRVSALAGDFLSIYLVVPETGQYREFSSDNGFAAVERPREGQDFFADTRKQALKVIFPEDQNRFISAFTRENILKEVEQNGIFTLSYRLMMNGEPRYVQLKAAMVEEKEGSRLIVGINDIDAQVRQEEEYGRRLAQARIEANIDALTGVKNRNAYRVYEERLNAQIEMNRAPGFSIVILDVNDLKKVNDTEGHKAGDQYLRDACRIICTTFKRSPVFRVGGDEFAVLSQGDDYERIDELVGQMNAHNEDAIENGGIVIAIGMARYEGEAKVAPVYERADQTMYENKSDLKAKKKQRG